MVLADALLVKPRQPAAFGMRQGTTRRDAPRSSRAADSRVALTSTPMKLLSMAWSLAFMSRVTAWAAGRVGGAREAMTRAEWDKVALTPRIDFDSCQWAGHPGLRGMAGPRRRISRRVLPLLLIIGVLGLGSRVLGPHPGGGVDGDAAATTADPGSHHRSSASNDENLGVAVVEEKRLKPGVNDDTVHVDAFDSPLPPLPRRVRSKPPPSRGPPAGGADRGRDTKKDEGTTGRQGTKKLVAGTAALTVDQRTHAADTDAAKAIANAGKQTSGYADALSTDKIVFATFVSNGFHEFMLNW